MDIVQLGTVLRFHLAGLLQNLDDQLGRYPRTFRHLVGPIALSGVCRHTFGLWRLQSRTPLYSCIHRQHVGFVRIDYSGCSRGTPVPKGSLDGRDLGMPHYFCRSRAERTRSPDDLMPSFVSAVLKYCISLFCLFHAFRGVPTQIGRASCRERV